MRRLFTLLLLSSGLPVFAAKEYDGSLQWGKEVRLGLPVSGTVFAVPVQVGASVRKNQLLIKLDQRPFKSKVLQAQAQLRKTDQAFIEAKREYERAKELFDRTVLSNTELEQAESRFKSLQAQIDHNKAELEQVQLDLQYSQLQAPFDGIIAKVKAEVGQTIVSRLQAEPLIVLVQNSIMIAKILTPVEELANFEIGKAVMVKVGFRIYSGKISVVGFDPVQSKKGVLYEVDIEFPTEGQSLRSGQSVKVVLP